MHGVFFGCRWSFSTCLAILYSLLGFELHFSSGIAWIRTLRYTMSFYFWPFLIWPLVGAPALDPQQVSSKAEPPVFTNYVIVPLSTEKLDGNNYTTQASNIKFYLMVYGTWTISSRSLNLCLWLSTLGGRGSMPNCAMQCYRNRTIHGSDRTKRHDLKVKRYRSMGESFSCRNRAIWCDSRIAGRITIQGHAFFRVLQCVGGFESRIRQCVVAAFSAFRLCEWNWPWSFCCVLSSQVICFVLDVWFR